MDITITIDHALLDTPRLQLRPWREGDLQDFFDYASVPGVGEIAGWPHHETLDDSRAVLQQFITDRNTFAIVYRENNKVIGSVGLHQSWANVYSDYTHFVMKNIGYVLSKDFWGKGLMTEAVTAVIRYCFNAYPLDAMTCGHAPENRRSQRVIEKCGFTYVKQSTYYDSQLQMTFSGLRYILLRPDLSPTHDDGR